MSARSRGLARIAPDRRHLVAAQVRHCSSGFTQGVVVEGEAKPRGLAPRDPRETQAVRTATPMWWLKIGAAAPKGMG